VSDMKQLTPELEVKEVPARRVAFVRERVHMDEMKNVVPRNIDAVTQAIGMRHAGSPFLRARYPVEEGYFETEVGWPVPDDVEVEQPFEVTTYPAIEALVIGLRDDHRVAGGVGIDVDRRYAAPLSMNAR
jgi:hypothetical protein